MPLRASRWSRARGALTILLCLCAAAAGTGSTAAAGTRAAAIPATPAPPATPATNPKDKSIPAAPPRAEGEGPFARLILRGATVIDGTGAPAIGPVDIVIESNRIVRVESVGQPGGIDPDKRPKAAKGDKEIDFSGLFVLPGFVDLHAHIGGKEQGTPAGDVFKLWLGHGATTIRHPGRFVPTAPPPMENAQP